MNKIANTIGYRTIPETVEYIARKINEDVKELDIYQLALSRKITLAIRFGHGSQSARKVVDVFNSSDGFPFAPNQENLDTLLCHYSDSKGNNAAILDVESCYGLTDIYDLSLCGSDKREIEKLRNRIILGENFEESKRNNTDGIFVKDAKGTLFCLVEMNSKLEFNYIPIRYFPSESFLVVRIEEINRFINSVLDTNQKEGLQDRHEGSELNNNSLTKPEPIINTLGAEEFYKIEAKELLSENDGNKDIAVYLLLLKYGQKGTGKTRPYLQVNSAGVMIGISGYPDNWDDNTENKKYWDRVSRCRKKGEKLLNK